MKPLSITAVLWMVALGAKPTPSLAETSQPSARNPEATPLQAAATPAAQYRLKFQTYDGDPRKPETMNFQISRLDIRQPSEFLKLGDLIPGTRLKLEKFEFKEITMPNQENRDVSELTVTDLDTHGSKVLVLTKVTDIAAPAPAQPAR